MHGAGVLLAKRLVDGRKGELMREELAERIPLGPRAQQFQCLAQALGPIPHQAEDGLSPVHDRRRIELARQPLIDVADLQIGAAVAQHLDSFGHDGRRADQLHHDVGPLSLGQLADAPHAGLGRLEFLHVDRHVGAEIVGQLEPRVDPVDHDHLRHAAALSRRRSH